MAKEKRIHRLDRISETAVKKLDPARTLVIATMSPLEVHGPHLPIGQDWFEAETLTRHSMEAVAKERKDWSFLMLPPVPIATDCVPHFGSVGFPVTVVRDVAYQLLLPFAKRGFTRLAFSSFHGGPRHICALEDAAHKLSRFDGVACISLFSAAVAGMFENGDNIFSDALLHEADSPLTAEQLNRDHHAGFIETSLALHLWPELVEPGWEKIEPLVKQSDDERDERNTFFNLKTPEKGLPGDLLKKFAAIVREVKSTADHYKKHTYAGYPADSSAKSGKIIFDHLVVITKDIIIEFMDQGREMNGHTPLWKMKDFLLNPAVNFVLEDWLKLFSD